MSCLNVYLSHSTLFLNRYISGALLGQFKDKKKKKKKKKTLGTLLIACCFECESNTK